MKTCSVALLVLLFASSVAVEGPSFEDSEDADDVLMQPDAPPVGDADKDKKNDYAYAPRVVVLSVLGFIMAMVIAATFFFVYKKKATTPLDTVFSRLFLRKSDGEPVRGEVDYELSQVARPPEIANSGII